ncbi:glyoxylate reductase [Opitutales bacterium ASA1]|uniref:2-hydroxyacid dehydrogenase n=1 Tax=Congregicoccus parvus TaxID=3081749 RepID=UPI002B29996F|nr:glyoxylate reductase [Opitutales bacterium ASA1]
MKPRVYLTRRLPDAVMERLAAQTDLAFHDGAAPVAPEELHAALKDREALIPTVSDRIDAAVLAHAPVLRVIANFGVGYNNIDVAAATKRGIQVTNTPDVLTAATADVAFGLLLATARRFGEGERMVREGRWHGWDPLQLLGADIAGATLGLIGFGRIGQAVAHRARAFDMRVLYWNRTRLEPGIELELGVDYRERDELLAESDFVSLHVAYTPETHHLIDASALARMKPSAILVNTARGSIVDEAALVEALKSGRISAAGLDVFEREPHIHAGLYPLSNCVLLPHLGSATIGTRTRMGMLALDNLLAACAGKRPPNLVNPDALAAAPHR